MPPNALHIFRNNEKFRATHSKANLDSPMKPKAFAASIALFLASTLCGADNIKFFPGALPKINVPSQQIDYNIDLQTEPYVIHVPASYNGTKPFGLIVFVPATGGVKAAPKDWEKVLAD